MNANSFSLLSLFYRGADTRFALHGRALLATAALLAFPATGFAFVEVARGELFLNTTARATYDSNVFARPDSESDLYLSLIPELQFLRQAGRGTIDARAGVDFTRFLDFSDQDYEDFYGSLDVGLPTHSDSPLSGNVSVGFAERTGIHEFLVERVSRENYHANSRLLYRTSERLGIRNQLAFSYQRAQGFSNTQSLSGTIGAQYEYSENLSLFSDYRLRRATSSGRNQSVENIDHALFLGGTGELRPRLTGTLSAGYQHTDSRGDRGEDTNMFVAATELAWQMRPRTELTLNVSRDMHVSPDDFTAEMFNTTLGANHRIEPKIELDAYTGYSRIRYRGGDDRRDEGIHLGAGARYIFSQYWNAGIGYQFTDNDSNRRFANYTRHMFNVSTRYTF